MIETYSLRSLQAWLPSAVLNTPLWFWSWPRFTVVGHGACGGQKCRLWLRLWSLHSGRGLSQALALFGTPGDQRVNYKNVRLCKYVEEQGWDGELWWEFSSEILKEGGGERRILAIRPSLETVASRRNLIWGPENNVGVLRTQVIVERVCRSTHWCTGPSHTLRLGLGGKVLPLVLETSHCVSAQCNSCK